MAYGKYLLIIFLLIIVGITIFIKQKKISVLKQDGLYKIVPISDFDKTNTENCITLSPLDNASDFIHASYGHQVLNIMSKFFKDEEQVLALELDRDVLEKHGTTVRPEANKPGGTIFPHLYGEQKIPMIAVKNIIWLEKTCPEGFKVKR